MLATLPEATDARLIAEPAAPRNPPGPAGAGEGRITIPKAVRTRCGIHEGDVLAVTADGNPIIMTKLESLEQATLQSLDATLGE